VPFHWGGEDSVNRLTSDATDPVSGMPEFKVCAVDVVAGLPVDTTVVPVPQGQALPVVAAP
jgi:assimilatory nitrate reductase catalytic subunit